MNNDIYNDPDLMEATKELDEEFPGAEYDMSLHKHLYELSEKTDKNNYIKKIIQKIIFHGFFYSVFTIFFHFISRSINSSILTSMVYGLIYFLIYFLFRDIKIIERTGNERQ